MLYFLNILQKYRYECAQHNSAGDFRTDGGITPKLVVQNETVWCKTKMSPSDAKVHGMYGPLPENYHLFGSLVLKHNGELVLFGDEA